MDTDTIEQPKTNAHAGEGGPPFRTGGGKWRERKDDGRGQPIPFPTCSWCGSMTPQQFIACIEAGCACEVADWKYGWPHKVYVMVPNPNPDELRYCGSTSVGSKICYNKDGTTYYEKTQEEPPEGYTYWDSQSGWSKKGTYRDSQLKFYTEHLEDLGPGELEKHHDLILKATGVHFKMGPNGLQWAARPRGRYDGA